MDTKQLRRVSINALAALVLLMFGSCERSVSDLEPPGNPVNPDVFIDGFSAGLNFAAFSGTVPSAFQVDEEETFDGSDASMRFEVPDANDPRGAFAGGVFFTDPGRDLSQFTALTFQIKASKAATIDLLGFGNDLGESRFQASISGLRVNSNWQKVIIPLPDPSKLDAEKGMFLFSEGPEDPDGEGPEPPRGYTFWVDELKFEVLGSIAQREFSIFQGEEQSTFSFIGINQTIDGLNAIFNLPTGIDRSVNLTPAYFEFNSTSQDIATVTSDGIINIVGGPGTTQITATVNGVAAEGSLTIDSRGAFQPAPIPTEDPEDVISIFSNSFNNVPIDFFNGFFEPFQTTTSDDFTVNGDDVLFYRNFNFVAIQFANPTVDVTSMNTLTMDIFFPNDFTAGERFEVELISFGPDGAFGGGDDSSSRVVFRSPFIRSQEWISINIPLSRFSGVNDFENIAQILFVGENIPGFFADNIYFRVEQ